MLQTLKYFLNSGNPLILPILCLLSPPQGSTVTLGLSVANIPSNMYECVFNYANTTASSVTMATMINETHINCMLPMSGELPQFPGQGMPLSLTPSLYGVNTNTASCTVKNTYHPSSPIQGHCLLLCRYGQPVQMLLQLEETHLDLLTVLY